PVGEDTEELPEHLHRQLVLGPKDFEEIHAPDRDELGAPIRIDGGRPRYRPDERHLSKVLACSETCQSLASARDRDLAREHDEKLVSLVAFANDELAGLVLADLHGLHDAEQLAVGEACEERHPREDVALEGEAFGALVVLGVAAQANDDDGDVVLAA